ncbi:MAG: outer membrane assembly protein, partial [Pseudomonas sp.]|nr:outer membrane assembly protein [Pseudomonas sp.]
KAVARARHRMDWPETNVGAGLPAKRRAGGARSHRR